MGHFDYEEVLEHITNEYHTLTKDERLSILEWSLRKDKCDIFNKMLYDTELKTHHRLILKRLINRRDSSPMYNLIIHSGFTSDIPSYYWSSILEVTYKKDDKLFNYVIGNFDDVYDGFTIDFVKLILRNKDVSLLQQCMTSDELRERITSIKPTLFTEIKELLVCYRKEKINRIINRINEKQRT